MTEHDPSSPETSKAERILQAAEELLAEGGHASLTVANIVRRAGVSRGLIHYYFDSMEDILLRIIQRQARESLERAAGFVEEAPSRGEVIDTFVAAFAQVLKSRPELYALYFEAYVQSRVHDSVRDQLAEVYQNRRDALAKGLLAAEEQGLVHLPHGASAVASIIIAVSQGIALQHLSDPEMLEDDVWAVVRTMFDRLLDRPTD